MTTTTLARDIHVEYTRPVEHSRQARELLKLWFSRARQRRHLRTLTAEQLDDVGITQDAAHVEAAKPFWRK